MSKSRAGDTGSYDDYVDVVTFGSAFSICGFSALHALASLHRRSFAVTILALDGEFVKREEAQKRGQDPAQRALIHHFSLNANPATSQNKTTTTTTMSPWPSELSFSLYFLSLSLLSLSLTLLVMA